MTIIRQNTFDGGTAGTAITTANSGGASGNAIDYVGPSASGQFTYASPPWGGTGLACRFQPHATNSYYLRWDEVSSDTRKVMEMDILLPSIPTGSTSIMQIRTTANAQLARLDYDATGKFAVFDGVNGHIASLISPIISPQKVTVQFSATQSTGGATGAVGIRILNSAGVALHAPAEATGVTTQSAAPAGQYRFSGITTSTGWTDFYMDNLKVHALASGWPPSSATPIVITTDNKYHVIDARSSTTPSGTNTFSITQISGPTTAPVVLATGLWGITPHTVSNLVYEITANNGTATDTEQVTVTPASATGGSKLLRYNGTEWA